MDKLIDIQTLTNKKNLQEFAEKQMSVLLVLKEENEKLKEEVAALKAELSTKPSPTARSEEILLLAQVEILKAKGLVGELTLEETKKLDIFLKNLHLLNSVGDSKPGTTVAIKDYDNLIKLAKTKPDVV